MTSGSRAADDPLFSGRGAPALISTKEPALRLLRERYSEVFALSKGTGKRIHLFVIKYGLWSLAWTFTTRELGQEPVVDAALRFLEAALSGGDTEFMQKLDSSVARVKVRIESKAEEFRK